MVLNKSEGGGEKRLRDQQRSKGVGCCVSKDEGLGVWVRAKIGQTSNDGRFMSSLVHDERGSRIQGREGNRWGAQVFTQVIGRSEPRKGMTHKIVREREKKKKKAGVGEPSLEVNESLCPTGGLVGRKGYPRDGKGGRI